MGPLWPMTQKMYPIPGILEILFSMHKMSSWDILSPIHCTLGSWTV
ncbi:hypothetical protein LEMLEM_LOCUS6025 [Lemmus lemmus]